MEGGRKGKRGEGGLACVQGLLLPGLGEGWVGWDSERSCSQVRSGKDFAAQHIFFLLLTLMTFSPTLDLILSHC